MIYLMTLVRMEELTGLPTRVLFPAVDAASGGAPITAALYGPNPMSAKEAFEGFYAGASRFYPPRDNRLAKMFVAHGIHTIQEQIDSNVTDSLRLKDIRTICHIMKLQGDSGLHEAIDSL